MYIYKYNTNKLFYNNNIIRNIINITVSIQILYSQLPISWTRKGPGKVSDLARIPTYTRFRIACKYDMRCAA